MLRIRSLSVSLLLMPAMAMAQPAAAPPLPNLMGLTSTSFVDGGIIPDRYTQAVPSPVSPELAWTNVPAGTQSFALIVEDPDTALQRTSRQSLHWAAFNIPADKASLAEGVPNTPTLSDGTVQALNNGGFPGFRGPGASGSVYHHYTFQLYALDVKLDLGPDATRTQIGSAMDGHILNKAVLVGRFHRPLK